MKDNKFNKNHDEMYKELIYGNWQNIITKKMLGNLSYDPLLVSPRYC
jgi:hypothetical protein